MNHQPAIASPSAEKEVTPVPHFNPGDQVHVRVLHADGQPYRSWQAVVERVTEDCLITLSLLGSRVHDLRGDWITDVRIRGYYWLDRPYNLLEEYGEDGALRELYVNVAQPPALSAHGFDVVDHELDVTWKPGQPARILDEDEFAAAADRYGYTPDFQSKYRATAVMLLNLVETWQPAAAPAPWPALSA